VCLALSTHVNSVLEQMPWVNDSSAQTAYTEEACENQLFAALQTSAETCTTKKDIKKTKNIKNFGIAGQQKARKEGKNDSIKSSVYSHPAYISTLKICRVGLYSELFYAITPYFFSLLFADLRWPTSHCIMNNFYKDNCMLVNKLYYCTTGRAIWGNIQLEGGSIGPTEGRENTEPES